MNNSSSEALENDYLINHLFHYDQTYVLELPQFGGKIYTVRPNFGKTGDSRDF